jgi:hypothetical protein
MIPLRKSELILHTSLLTSVILTAKPILYKYILLVKVICEKYRFRGQSKVTRRYLRKIPVERRGKYPEPL